MGVGCGSEFAGVLVVFSRLIGESERLVVRTRRSFLTGKVEIDVEYL